MFSAKVSEPRTSVVQTDVNKVLRYNPLTKQRHTNKKENRFA